MLVFNPFFLKLLFFWICLLFFQDTHNTQLKERYNNDPSTYLNLDLNLLLEVGLSGRPNRNRVYDLSTTTAKNLWTTWSVSIVGCSQSVLSTQTPKFEAILDQRVQARTTYLAADYERLSAKKAKLHQLIMEMRS
jgi:hypothetical protein